MQTHHEVDEDTVKWEACDTPSDEYAEGKARVHTVLLEAWRRQDFPFVALLPPFFVGPAPFSGDVPDTRHWAYQLVASSPPWRLDEVLAHRRFRIIASEIDVASAALAASKAGVASLGEFFHVAGAELLSIRDYLETIHSILSESKRSKVDKNSREGVGDPVAHFMAGGWQGPFFSGFASRPWGAFSINKAKRMLGWQPEPFRELMQRTVEWWLQHGEEIADAGHFPTDLPPEVLAEQCDAEVSALRANRHERCMQWAEGGECQKNPGFMLSNCRHSCRVCDDIKHKPIVATFVNHHTHTVHIFWRASDKDEVRKVGELAPGEDLGQQTHIGHVFVVVGEQVTEREYKVRWDDQLFEIGHGLRDEV
eukprot:TRINITY_DN25245_c0_g1_i2.p1 TRINITY_DN25245_c0_g1~~TRINITY_DN25245_c0_g1_i2.p1  ORF type:complete len:366 (-),score=51.22 TRINITY_DN25245_c0_g1_i2:176-1273(-)